MKNYSDYHIDDRIRKNIGAIRTSVELVVPPNMYLWIWGASPGYNG